MRSHSSARRTMGSFSSERESLLRGTTTREGRYRTTSRERGDDARESGDDARGDYHSDDADAARAEARGDDEDADAIERGARGEWSSSSAAASSGSAGEGGGRRSSSGEKARGARGRGGGEGARRRFVGGAVAFVACVGGVMTYARHGSFGGMFGMMTPAPPPPNPPPSPPPFPPPPPPNPPPPHPHHPPKPPPPPLVDCDASHGDRATGLYQQYNPQCTADEGVPANCVGTEGCQFCHLEESRAAKGGSTEKCSAWVCAKYDVTGCKGIHRNKKAEKKHFDIGDCSNDVGNRNVGRHVFRDWDCASEEGVPSACQKPGKTPCRMCMLKSADDPVKGWPYCPSVVCDDLNIKRHECPGLDYVAKIGKSSKKKRDEDEDEDEDEKKHKSKKHSKNKNDLGEDEKTSKRSKKHSKHRDEDEDDDADEKKHKSRKHSKRKDDE